MKTHHFNPDGGELISNCVYASTYAKKYNCIVAMYHEGEYYNCEHWMSPKTFFETILNTK